MRRPHRRRPRPRIALGARRLAGEGGASRRLAVRPDAAGHGADAEVDRTGGRRRARAHPAGRPHRQQPEPDRALGEHARLDRRGRRGHRPAGQAVWPHVRLAPDPLYDVLVHGRDGPRAGGTTSASSRPAAGGVWRPARGRAAAPSTSTAAGPGDGSSGPPRRAPGAADATLRWSDERRRASSPPPVRKRPRRGAARFWRAGRIPRARRSSGRSPRGHRAVRRSDESAVLQRAYTWKTTAGRQTFIEYCPLAHGFVPVGPVVPKLLVGK